MLLSVFSVLMALIYSSGWLSDTQEIVAGRVYVSVTVATPLAVLAWCIFPNRSREDRE